VKCREPLQRSECNECILPYQSPKAPNPPTLYSVVSVQGDMMMMMMMIVFQNE